MRLAARRVLESGRRGSLMILSRFMHLVRLETGRRMARVESAIPLNEELQASIRGHLARIYGPGVSAHFAHNPALIGGTRIRVGSDVYDGSVRGALAMLEKSF